MTSYFFVLILHTQCPAHFCSLCGMSGDALRMVRCFGCKINAFHVSKCEPGGILELQKDQSGYAASRILCPSCVVKGGKAPDVKFALNANRSHKIFSLLESGKYLLGEVEELYGDGKSYSPPRIKSIGGEMGKPYYYFGSHEKGGGCDWVLPELKNKMHTRIRIDYNGIVIIEYALNSPKPFTYINGIQLQQRQQRVLKDGDQFAIGKGLYRYKAYVHEWPQGELEYNVCPPAVKRIKLTMAVPHS